MADAIRFNGTTNGGGGIAVATGVTNLNRTEFGFKCDIKGSLITTLGSGVEHYLLGIYGDDGEFEVTVRNASSNFDMYFGYGGPSYLSFGSYATFAALFDADENYTVYLYINDTTNTRRIAFFDSSGTLVDEADSTDAIAVVIGSNPTLPIGALYSVGVAPTVVIGGFAIYSTAPASESADPTAGDSNLLHLWLMDEGSGSTLANEVGSAPSLSLSSSYDWLADEGGWEAEPPPDPEGALTTDPESPVSEADIRDLVEVQVELTGATLKPLVANPSFSTASPTGTTAGAGRTGNGDLTIPWPTSYSPTAGHFAILTLYHDQGTGSTPSGWTQVTGSPFGTGTPKKQVWVKKLLGSEGSVTTTISGSGTNVAHSGGILIYAAGKLGAVGSGSQGTGTPMTASGITTTQANAIVVALWGRGDNESSSGQTFNASTTGVTERMDSGTGEGNDAQVSAADKSFPDASSSTGTASATTSATDPWVGVQLEIIPDTPFNDARADARDGLVGDGEEEDGFNAHIGSLAVSAITRISDTVIQAAISLPGLDITEAEDVTWTIPASILVAGGPVVAEPTFTIEPGDDPGNEGTAAIVLPPVELEASGAVVTEGTGTATLPAVQTSAQGAPVITGTASLGLPSARASAVGSPIVEGTVAIPLASLGTSASGETVVAGTSAAILPALAVDGTGESDIEGVAAVELPGLEVAAQGESTVTGTGAATLPALETEAEGATVVEGAAGIVLPSVDLSADGTPVVEGEADITLPALVLIARDLAEDSGEAEIVLPVLEVAAVGESTVDGEAEAELPALSATAAGYPVITGTASFRMAPVSATAQGATDTVGAGSVVLPGARSSASGVVLIQGLGAIRLPFLRLMAMEAEPPDATPHTLNLRITTPLAMGGRITQPLTINGRVTQPLTLEAQMEPGGD